MDSSYKTSIIAFHSLYVTGNDDELDPRTMDYYYELEKIVNNNWEKYFCEIFLREEIASAENSLLMLAKTIEIRDGLSWCGIVEFMVAAIVLEDWSAFNEAMIVINASWTEWIREHGGWDGMKLSLIK